MTIPPITLRQLHLYDSYILPFASEQRFTSSSHPAVIVLDAARAAGMLAEDAADLPAAEARALADQITELVNEARDIPKA